MSHSHSHILSRNRHNSRKNILLAFMLNLGFSIIELAGGLITNSVAILSDALHDFGDSISLGMAWYFEKISERKPDARYTFGYKRFALLGALINSAILLTGSVIVIFESIKRIVHPEEVIARGMFGLAILGIVINGFAVWRTRHSSSINERVVSLHLLEDVLGWIAVLIASTFMMFFDLPMLDPLLSIGISCYILFNVFRNLRATFNIILEGVPENIDLATLKNRILEIPEIRKVHDVHVWTLDSQYNLISLHIVVDPEKMSTISQRQAIKQQVKKLLNQNHIDHITIEIESSDEKCSDCNLL